jgi:hypothetical protein
MLSGRGSDERLRNDYAGGLRRRFSMANAGHVAVAFHSREWKVAGRGTPVAVAKDAAFSLQDVT